MSHTMSRLGRLTSVVLALVAVLALAACGSSKDDQSSSSSSSSSSSGTADNAGGSLKKGLTVAFLPKQVNNPYFSISDKGGLDTLKTLGEKGKRVGPSDANASSQVSYINTLTSQKVDAIAISASDPNAVTPSLRKAMQQGIKVVSYDSDTAPDGRNVFINQVNPQLVGQNQVEMLGKQIGYKGDFAILSATPNATNQNAWIDVMKQELKKPKYQNMKLVKVAYGNDDDQKSFQETQGLLQAYPNLKGIISPTTVGIAAAARYISSSKYKGKVKLTGLGTPNQLRKFVNDGTIDAFSLWDPAKLGSLAAYAAANLASGTISGKAGESFDAGPLGKKTIEKDGVVFLGPPQVFDKSNIDQFNF